MSRIKLLQLATFTVFSLMAAMPSFASETKVTPKRMVTRAETATAIAKAVADEAYGKEVISEEMPFLQECKGNVWHVSGQLRRGIPGGVVEVWISARDGRVLKLVHGM